MDEITERQKEILRFIVKTTEDSGFPPTIREIGGAFNITSTNGVNDHLKALERKGYLSRGEQKSRSFVPTPSGRNLLGMHAARSRVIEVPVLGRVAAGAPLLAEQNLDETMQIDPSVLPQAGKDCFALKVKGDSMIEDGIFDGDLVFVRRQPSARSGEIVVAMIDGEATVKRFFLEGNRLRLQPANAAMEPIYVSASQAKDTSILGIVVGVFRKMQMRA
jgi:repressor LexA